MHQEKQEQTGKSFNGLGIAPALLDILARLRFTAPTPIQEQAIPIAIQGKDMVGIAQTGTGKTLAFGVPMIQRIGILKKQGLIVLPTRELAAQVEEVMRKVGQGLGIRTAILIGGAGFGPQLQALRKNPHIIIATPGRLIDHLERKTIRLDAVGIVVLDEADRMLDMGFWPQIQRIFSALPKERQVMLFSATMPPEIMKIASAQMQLPVQVEIATTGTTAERVTQELFIVPADRKIALLAKLFEQYKGPTLVFARTKHGVKRIAGQIRMMGVNATEIHSNRTLGQRRDALEGFKIGRYRVLVATDIASRGIDVRGIELVVNYDLPMSSEDYVHRIGRTARAGAGGHAIAFALPTERNAVRAIERLTRKSLPISALPEGLPQVSFVAPAPVRYSIHRRRSSPYRASSGFRPGGNTAQGFRRSKF
ncbi:MAG: DEAD/DEAH box helicase [Candidatus Sungiibacteriota bacterium]